MRPGAVIHNVPCAYDDPWPHPPIYFLLPLGLAAALGAGSGDGLAFGDGLGEAAAWAAGLGKPPITRVRNGD